MKNCFWYILLPIVCLLCVSIATAQDDPAPSPEQLSKFMRAKLVHSQKLLEALVAEDYGQLEKQAQDLKLLSHESNWNVLQTEEYVLDSSDFRRRADGLIKAAKSKNLEGASLSFVELTLSCVHCHKHVRDVRKKTPDATKVPLPLKK